MNIATKLSAYGAALVVLIGAAYLAGSAVGPLRGVPASDGHREPHGGGVAAPAEQPQGLASSEAGYTFAPADRTLNPGVREEFSFRINRADGTALSSFEVSHDKRMHLIVVRRDGTGYQHLHPEMDSTGTWRVPLLLAAGGSYRAFADFTPAGGKPSTLGVDLDVSGEYLPVAGQSTRTALLGSYQVDLIGDLTPGRTSTLTLTVRKDGVPVTDLQPYLAAYGHLVVLREGDLAYLHVHPDGSPGDGRTMAGPEIRFYAEVPSAGSYRLFLDFQHAEVVRTAEFTVPTGTASAGVSADTDSDTEPSGTDQHGSHNSGAR